jgi:hypothetical protein
MRMAGDDKTRVSSAFETLSMKQKQGPTDALRISQIFCCCLFLFGVAHSVMVVFKLAAEGQSQGDFQEGGQIREGVHRRWEKPRPSQTPGLLPSIFYFIKMCFLFMLAWCLLSAGKKHGLFLPKPCTQSRVRHSRSRVGFVC